MSFVISRAMTSMRKFITKGIDWWLHGTKGMTSSKVQMGMCPQKKGMMSFKYVCSTYSKNRANTDLRR